MEGEGVVSPVMDNTEEIPEIEATDGSGEDPSPAVLDQADETTAALEAAAEVAGDSEEEEEGEGAATRRRRARVEGDEDGEDKEVVKDLPYEYPTGLVEIEEQ